MTEEVVSAAIDALQGPRYAIADAFRAVPDAAGLYAVFGDQTALTELGLDQDDGSAVYIGKAERSLLVRDLRTHFATGRTGSSTLRRTLGALLREPIELRAIPRNTAKPDGSANYCLEASGDSRLTEWMLTHLTLAVWVKPAGVDLNAIETAVLAAISPPLNLSKMAGRSSRRVKAARATMASEARAWRNPSHGPAL